MAKKFGTFMLLLLMLCSVTLFVGCGKDENNDKDKDKDIVDKQDKDNENDNNEGIANKDENPKQEDKKEEKKVVLLKRNGVEWKENTSINSKKGAQKYTVVWGDTLSLIARTWGVNTYKLAKYNGIKDIDLIEVGQVIYNYAYKG